MSNSLNLSKTPVKSEPQSSSESENESFRTPKKRLNSTPRKKRRSSRNKSGGLENLDMAIDETMKSCMEKDKLLNPAGVKKILRKLVSNVHVLAHVRLREEEEQKKSAEKGSDADDEDDEIPIKITRAKAKLGLDSDVLPIVPLKPPASKSNEQTLALLHEDFHDDDTDPEYRPEEEDEANATISECDSLPATPKSSSTTQPEAVHYSADGKFKIPKKRLASYTQSEGEEEPIFKRTRTKISFKAADVEDLLLPTLAAPDFTPDLYSVDYEYDDNWTEFLEQLEKPINHNMDDAESDNDPEFNPIEEEAAVETHDREEMKNVRIPDTELNLLYKELSSIIDEKELERSGTPAKDFEQRIRSPRSLRRTKVCPTPLSTPPPRKPTPPPSTPITESAIKRDLLMNLISPEPSPTDQKHRICMETNQVQTVKLLNQSTIQEGEYQDITIRIPTHCKNVTIQTSSIDQFVPVTPVPQTPQIIAPIWQNNPAIMVQLTEPFYEPVPEAPSPIMEEIEPKLEIIESSRLEFFNFEGGVLEGTEILPEQRTIYAQQLRMHVQFCAQNFLQTYAHPNFWKKSTIFENMLDELNETFHENPPSNLNAALELVEMWKKKVNNEESSFGSLIVNQFENEQKKCAEALKRGRHLRPSFPDKIMREIFHSEAFPYVELLPTCAFKVHDSKYSKFEYTIAEEALMAIGLEKFYEDQFVPKNNGRKSSLIVWCKAVSDKMFFKARSNKSVYNQVLMFKKMQEINAINFYFLHNRAPNLVHNILIEGTAPIDRIDLLCGIWAKFASKLVKQEIQAKKIEIERNSEKLKGNKSIPKIPQEDLTKQPIASDTFFKAVNVAGLTIPIKLEVICRAECLPLEPPSTATSEERIKIEETNDVDDVPLALRSTKKNNQIVKLKPKKATAEKALALKARKLIDSIKRCHVIYDSILPYETRNHKTLKNVYTLFKTLDLYSQLCVELKEMCAATSNNKKVSSVGGSRFDVPSPESSAKRPRLDDKRSGKTNENPDVVYAMNFIEKVEETVTNEEEFARFLEILKAFDPRKDKIADLYFKLEKIFSPNYPELLNLFLTFLLPGQAAEVGKFFEYFIMKNMTTFREKLNIYFAKQPGQIRKIYTCINDLSQIEDVSMETVKESILPLLKGNPFLISWFLQIFPSEKPLDCNEIDSETLFMRKNEPQMDDFYEEFVMNDSGSLEPQSSCGVKYLGGIVYSGRMCTLPARLSFLAHDATIKTEEMSSQVSCSHAIKDFAEAKVQEKQRRDSTEQPNNIKEEIEEIDEPLVIIEPSQIVDKNVLKAHAIRLNPVVHATNGETYADISHLLVSPASTAERYFNEDTRSPTKSSKNQTNKPKNKLSSPPKASIKSSIQKSPKPGPCPVAQSSVGGGNGAILKAKKLKALVDVNEQSEETPPPPPPEEPVATPTPPPPPPIQEWTRNEDKIILEEQTKGSHEQVPDLLNQLMEKLPNRSMEDIEKRYNFLMEIMRKIQDKQ